ncbi:hypothetical protein [Marinobacter sp. 2_MG-2023]|uniref:hypothetical protein n=1 Tax=Marinobacter sp. 2_MG-2023 TaxID=3062679 RepID=UPI0026E1D36A|nr:hypothetical protein [Marinobacter sp. 2_MG-2023]MDO6440990.1 hypothetical protein [Marinobacter sp. 2_MG-2023]
MSEHDRSVLGEEYSHKISEEFDSLDAAERCVESLESLGVSREQVEVIRPNDPGMERKVEPETQGIARSLVQAHVRFGLVGLVIGLTVAALMVTLGPELTRSSPVLTFVALGFLFPVLALLIAGAVSLRPDHDIVIEKVRMAKDDGRWTVVAHCDSIEQQKLAKTAMGNSVQTL